MMDAYEWLCIVLAVALVATLIRLHRVRRKLRTYETVRPMSKAGMFTRAVTNNMQKMTP